MSIPSHIWNVINRFTWQWLFPTGVNSPDKYICDSLEHEHGVRRINSLTDTLRVNWLTLLAFFIYIIITTLSVKDVDFFVDSHQTKLPLIDTLIPTNFFFLFAPIIGTALHIYLHLHIRKLTEALAKTTIGSRPLEEDIKPWLLNDFVLRKRGYQAIQMRPMDWLMSYSAFLLIWWFAPLVIGLMLVWTWPAHNWWISVACVASLILAIYVALVSWVKMHRDLKRNATWSRLRVDRVILVFSLLIAWLMLANSQGIFVIPGSWFFELKGPNMIGEEISALPLEDVDYETSRYLYRKAFCELRGINIEACDRVNDVDYKSPMHSINARDHWCAAHGYNRESATSCNNFFLMLDREFEKQWRDHRARLIASVAKSYFSGLDLRNATFANAKAAGADFSQARLAQSNFNRAQLEMAKFIDTSLEGASLSYAWLESANFQEARLLHGVMNNTHLRNATLERTLLLDMEISRSNLENAFFLGSGVYDVWFWESNLQNAIFIEAILRMVDFGGTKLHGADFRNAHLEGVNISGVNLQESNWVGAEVSSVVALYSDLRATQGLSQRQLSGMVGNYRTLLPDTSDEDVTGGLFIPSCWIAEPDHWSHKFFIFTYEYDYNLLLSEPYLSTSTMRDIRLDEVIPHFPSKALISLS